MIKMIDQALPGKVGQRHYIVHEKDLPKFEFQARVIRDLDALESHAEQWNRLMATAVHANPFFDPDFLIPAIRHLDSQRQVEVLVVEAPSRVWPEGLPVWCALIPMVNRRLYGLPFRGCEIWKHDQCFDRTPLIRHDCAQPVLEYVFRFLQQQLGCHLLGMDTVAGEGGFQQHLTELLSRKTYSVFYRDAFNRACFRPSVDSNSYLKTDVSSKTRKESSRQKRRLQDQHCLEVRHSDNSDNKGRWVDDFLRLEASGWKGQQSTALASTKSTREFFAEMATRSMAKSKMAMLQVSVDGQPAAMLCDLHAGDRGAAYKLAFDESWSSYSPAVIAELENIEYLHARGVSLMDSCATSDHSMINRIWPQRIRMQSLVLGLGTRRARLATAAMPLIQWLRHGGRH